MLKLPLPVIPLLLLVLLLLLLPLLLLPLLLMLPLARAALALLVLLLLLAPLALATVAIQSLVAFAFSIVRAAQLVLGLVPVALSSHPPILRCPPLLACALRPLHGVAHLSFGRLGVEAS